MPAIPASGAISLSDFATEFGGTAPHSMSEYYRNGANVPSNNSNVPTAGAFRFGQMRGAINEIILAATSAANVDLSGLFGANWTSTVPKRLTVPAGVTIGGTGSSAALIIPANMAGTLEIDNAGSIIGKGGAANGGAGGHAIQNLASGVTINNTGLLAGGGGGGGLAGNGGTGGGGSFSTTSTPYQGKSTQYATSGTAACQGYVRGAGSCTGWFGQGNAAQRNRWCECSYGSGAYSTGNTFCQYGRDGDYVYQAQCYKTVTTTTSTSGGAGGASGNGGVGQGYNQSNTNGSSGSAGAAGGTNAGSGGSGGTGGNGGTYGSSGASGAAGNLGANGNVSGGSSGSSGALGGAAGAAVAGTTVTMNNSGTLYGAVA